MSTPATHETENAGIETIRIPTSVAEQGIAESMLRDARIPFQNKNDGLQSYVGGGSHPLIGVVEIQVPAAYADEARRLFEPAPTAGESLDEVPAELKLPPVPPDPRVAKVRRLALASVVCSFLAFVPIGPPIGVALGVWALALSREGVPLRWKLFAAASVIFGLVGTFSLFSPAIPV